MAIIIMQNNYKPKILNEDVRIGDRYNTDNRRLFSFLLLLLFTTGIYRRWSLTTVNGF